MIPNMMNVVKRYSFPVTHITTTQTVVNYQPVITEITASVKMNLQPMKPDEIIKLGYDVSLRFVRIFSLIELVTGDFVEHNGIRYKIISPVPYSDYGYWEGFGEEVKL